MVVCEVDGRYINYLSTYAPHLFQNKKSGQKNERKYIGIVFEINGFEYFAPLSSFKDKHRRMKESVDFIKIMQRMKQQNKKLSHKALTKKVGALLFILMQIYTV